MKNYLLSTFLGVYVYRLRNNFRLLKAILSGYEHVGIIINQQIANKLIVELNDPSKVFVDVGAHVGLFISLVKNHNKLIQIIGIEPIQEKVKDLRKYYPNITFYECAVGESSKEATFNIYPDRDGYSSLFNFLDSSHEVIKQVSVKVKTLDEILENEDVGVIKLIIEGGELDALKGGVSILKTHRPIVMLESSIYEDVASGNTIEDRWNFFVDIDYQLYIPIRVAHSSPSLSLDNFIESHHFPRRTLHYIAIPSERREEIRDKACKIQGLTS